MRYYRKNKNYTKTESVDEFIARGGKITKVNPIARTDKSFDEFLREFYSTSEWKTIRKRVFQNHEHICRSCAATEDLHVDHIKPIRHFWELRLTYENLQILCDECNALKGSSLNFKPVIPEMEYFTSLAEHRAIYEKYLTIVETDPDSLPLNEWHNFKHSRAILKRLNLINK